MMNKLKYALLPALLALLLIIAAPVAAQEAVSATLQPAVESTGITVGDPILLTLTVQHPAGTHLIAPDLPETWGDFTVAGISTPQTTTGVDGNKTTTLTIDARLFAPGDFQTPPLTIQLADTAGQLTAFDIAPLPVSVQSVLVEGDTELRDIKPPVDLPAANIILLFIGGLLAGTAGAAAAFWLWRSGRTLPIPVDNRPAYIIALAELDELEKKNLPGRRHIKPYYTILSDILRRFLGREYQIAVQEQTTTEINRSLGQQPMTPDLRWQLIHILYECDLVKFAGAPHGPAQAATILAETRAAIQATQVPVAAAAVPGRAATTAQAIKLTPAPLEVPS